MDLLKIIQNELKLDFSSTIIERDSGSSVENPFELSARDFLRYAKMDFKENGDKGSINALTNAKRSIDCQIDTALTVFGMSIDKSLKQSALIIKHCGFDKIDLPFKLKLIQTLGFAPSGLVSKTRALRNKLEHFYQRPKKILVSESLELAELFVLSIESKINIIPGQFSITDCKNQIKEQGHFWTCIYVDFDYQHRKLILRFYKERQNIGEILLTENDEIFFGIVKMINNLNDQSEMEDALKVFLKILNHPIPEQNINLKIE